MNFDKKSIIKICGILTFAIILYSVLQHWSGVKEGASTVMSYLLPFVSGGAIAFIINVPMRTLERVLFPKAHKLDKLRRPLALVLTLVLIVGALVLAGFTIIPQVAETISTLAVNIPEYMKNAQEYIEKLLADYPDILNYVEKFTSEFNWKDMLSSVSGWLSSGVVTTISAAGSAISNLVSVIVGFVFAIYILLQKERLGKQVRMIVYALVPEKAADKFFEITNMSSVTFSKFISGQCLEACILGCLFAISMAIFRMPYIALISVLIAFTALVPIVGAFIGCAVGAFLIFMESPIQALWFIVMFLIIQQIEGNLIYPKVVGGSVGLPAIWVLAVVTVGGKLMGVTGMLVMIPLSSVLYALFREFIVKRLRTKTARVQKMFFTRVQRPAAENNIPNTAEISKTKDKSEDIFPSEGNSAAHNKKCKRKK